MGDKTRGLYEKFKVERIDGSSESGGKHEGCDYFVLDLTHDKHSLPALQAYITSCRNDYPLLAADLAEKLSRKRACGKNIELSDGSRTYCMLQNGHKGECPHG